MEFIYFNEQWNESDEKQKNTLDSISGSVNRNPIDNTNQPKRKDVSTHNFFE